MWAFGGVEKKGARNDGNEAGAFRAGGHRIWT
jgi:hypothetical protein